MNNILEEIVTNKAYDDLGKWRQGNILRFSHNKNLFEYQIKAIQNVIKVLQLYYDDSDGLYEKYLNNGFNDNAVAIHEFLQGKSSKKIDNKKFPFFQEFFEIEDSGEGDYISAKNFINRAGLWMATGSGKSLVIIKLIEIIHKLSVESKLIPKKDLLILLPKNELLHQLKDEIAEYNISKSKEIKLVNLKEYNKEITLLDDIVVYYYRSDLLRNITKENIIDFRSYENNGNWYIFMDEAHKGSKEESLMQDYVSVMSRNGFLFNFSATFTEDIDYATTCYNFNLEKYITSGYGKNIYLSKSLYKFVKSNSEIDERKKILQFLKSLLTLTLIKKSKHENFYHYPLMVTLVNTIQAEDSDLMMFFNKIKEIAANKFDKKLFDQAKNELIDELIEYKSYIIGDEKLDISAKKIEDINIKDVLNYVYNTSEFGDIEISDGEKGKELILKVQNSDKPFALIKIGDTDSILKNNLIYEFPFTPSFEKKEIFRNINNKSDISMLIGSRSFYEGWDSNRPNVLNLINIGKKDAKKFVLQGIGRGVRIQPFPSDVSYRKRLQYDNPNKNQLLETLFIFPTDNNIIKAIIGTLDDQKEKCKKIKLFKNEPLPFDLLIPKFIDKAVKEKIADFDISKQSLENFKIYMSEFNIETLMIKKDLSYIDAEFILSMVNENEYSPETINNHYTNMNYLLDKFIDHYSHYNKEVINKLATISNEIVHFENIKIYNLSDEEIELLQMKIAKVSGFYKIAKLNKHNNFLELIDIYEEDNKIINEEKFKELKITKILEHYYLPVIYSLVEKQKYIKHIINVASEVKFLQKLENHISKTKYEYKWMFSKIDESLDSISIPYFSTKSNNFRKYFPDFIFWINKENMYKIVFIDPKSTRFDDYQEKVDYFEKLFMKSNNKPKEFEYQGKKVIFELKMVSKPKDSIIKDKYSKYWIRNDDFSFLDIK